MRTPRTAPAVLTLALSLAALLAVSGLLPARQAATASPVTDTTADGEDTRPNVVLILTDDQSTYDLDWMPHTKRLIGDHGVTYKNFLSPHPLCCPARAELLTGQYAQNNGVHHNTGPWGGWEAFDPGRCTPPTWSAGGPFTTSGSSRGRTSLSSCSPHRSRPTG